MTPQPPSSVAPTIHVTFTKPLDDVIAMINAKTRELGAHFSYDASRRIGELRVKKFFVMELHATVTFSDHAAEIKITKNTTPLSPQELAQKIIAGAAAFDRGNL